MKNILIGKLELSRLMLSSVLSLIIGVSTIVLLGCGQETLTEPEIPVHFSTYTDENALFSISYPPDWEPALSIMEEVMEYAKDAIRSIEEDLPVEKSSLIFIAGLPIETGYMPNVNIVLGPLPLVVSTNDEFVEAQIRGIKSLVEDYHEFSRIKTTVDGREATILECEGSYPELRKGHFLQMFIVQGKNGWVVTCTPPSGEFNKWEEDFNSIVRSLPILK